MFVRNGEALGSIKWDAVSKSAKVPAYETPPKKGARKQSVVKAHEEQVEAAGDSFPVATPVEAPEPEADDEVAEADESEAPPESARKSEWVDFAVSCGADRSWAEDSKTTKQDLIDEFGG
jgi:hypothetical protein